MRYYQQFRIQFLLTLSLAALSAFGYAQTNESEVFNISSDYDLLIEKIESQTQLSRKNEFDKFLSGIKEVTENNAINVNIANPMQGELLPEQLYEVRRRGVMMIGCFYSCDGCSKIKTGIIASAVVLSDDGVCVTNQHVFKSRGLGAKADSSELQRHLYLSDIEGNIFPIQQILTYSQTADVAIFKIAPRGVKMNPIPIGTDVPVASTVHAITHPKGTELYYYSKGTVSRHASHLKDPLLDRIYVSCDYAVGSSGGPILDSSGNLVGIVSTTRPLYTASKEPMHLQMVLRGIVPVKTIKTLIK